MKLLALDQASRVSGYAIFDDGKLIDSGTFTTTSEHFGKRLNKYRDTIENLIDTHNIEYIIFEGIQLQEQSNNVETFRKLGEVYGVTEELASRRGISYEVVNSSHWRSTLGIHKGKVRDNLKKIAQDYVFTTYGKKVSQDESDAICIGASYYVNKESAYNWE